MINNSPYLGPSFTNNYIEKAIELKIEKRNDFEIKKMNTDEMVKYVANKIAEGNVIGFSGKILEFQERWEIDLYFAIQEMVICKLR